MLINKKLRFKLAGKKISNKLMNIFFSSLKSKVVVLLAIVGFWSVGSKMTTVDAYSFGSVYQHYLLGTQSENLIEGNSDTKVMVLGSLGSGGAAGEFSYDDIINSANDDSKEDAKKFVSMMSTYSTFNYFSNQIEGFSSVIPSVVRAILGLILMPLALMMDLLALIIPTIVGLIAKLNVINLLATSIEGSQYTSALESILGISASTIAKLATALMSFAVAMIILTAIRIFRTDSTIEQRQVSKLKGRLVTLICLPLIVGISADFLSKAMDFSTSVSATSAEFSRYLIDDRSWAYNFNFAPNGNDSNDANIVPSSDGSYVDLDLNPYKSSAVSRINSINENSSILNNESNKVFSNSALVLAYMTSATFSATDYLNYKGTEASTRLYGSSVSTVKTIGSYYTYANDVGDNLVDIEHSYVPSTGKPRKKEENSNNMQEGGYANAIDDYRIDDGETYTLKVSPQIAWRDRYIYGGKTSGENMDKYYSVAPSLEQIDNNVGSNGEEEYGITTQSVFLMLSTIFTETGGKYHMDTPTRGAYDKLASFDSNRSNYYVVSMLGTPFFTMFALVALPLIRLVVLLTVLTAVLSLGIIDMNIRPLMAYFKGLTIGSIEYCQAMLIYVIGIGATIALLVILPELLILLLTGVAELITFPKKFVDIVTISPQASLALEGVKHIFSCVVAMGFGYLYLKSPTFRKQLVDVFAMPWSYACAAGDRLEIQASGGLGRRAQSERDRMRSKNKLNAVLNGANQNNTSPFGALEQWANDTKEGIKNDLSFLRTNTDDIPDDDTDFTPNEPKNNSTTNPTQSSADLAREGKKARMLNTLNEMEASEDIPDDNKNDITVAEQSISEFYDNPTAENLTKAQKDLDILENNLRDEDIEDVSGFQKVHDVREELNDLAESFSIKFEDKDNKAENNLANDTSEENFIQNNNNEDSSTNLVGNEGSNDEELSIKSSDDTSNEKMHREIENRLKDGKAEEEKNSTIIRENSEEIRTVNKESVDSEIKTVKDITKEKEQGLDHVWKQDAETQNKQSQLQKLGNTTINQSNVNNAQTEKNTQKYFEKEVNQIVNNSTEKTNYPINNQQANSSHSKNEVKEIMQIENSLGNLSKNEHISKVLNEMQQSETPKDFIESIKKMRYSFRELSKEEIQTIDKDELQEGLTKMMQKKQRKHRKKNKLASKK